MFVYHASINTDVYNIYVNHTFNLALSRVAMQMMSLMCDGLTGGVQDKMISEHRAQAHLLMYWMNFWASMYLVICKSI